MPHLRGHAYELAKFEAALKGRRVALDSYYRGLFVASVSSFEGFVKMFISALVQIKSAGAHKFSDLPVNFQQQYVVRASQVLANVGSGSVKGIPFNFSALQRNVGICFTDTAQPTLDGDVFTILMGNPTWGRLISLLESLGIAKPFDQSFGSTALIRGWGKAAWKKNLSDAEAKLDALLDQRNRIVHCLALGGVDLTSAAGKMTMGVINAVAEFERDLLIERTHAGLNRAKAEGRKLGRPAKLSASQQDAIRTSRAQGISLGALAKEYGVPRSAIQRAEKRAASPGT